jgi:3',5'-cyclic AMP phosphodiesterase CpdA
MCGDDGVASFPFVRRVGPLALIGVNSAHPTPPIVAAGRVGRPQLKSLAALLDQTWEEGATRVVLIHHPPLPGLAPRLRGLVDAPELQQVLDKHGAELVLHGHNHRNRLERRRWSKGDMAVLGIASASAGRVHEDESLARYNLIRFCGNRDEGRIEILARGLAEAGGRVVELERHVLRAGSPAAA